MMNPKVPPLETADDLCHYSAAVTGCYARICLEHWLQQDRNMVCRKKLEGFPCRMMELPWAPAAAEEQCFAAVPCIYY